MRNKWLRLLEIMGGRGASITGASSQPAGSAESRPSGQQQQGGSQSGSGSRGRGRGGFQNRGATRAAVAAAAKSCRDPSFLPPRLVRLLHSVTYRSLVPVHPDTGSEARSDTDPDYSAVALRTYRLPDSVGSLGSGSFYHQGEIVRKSLILTVLLLFLTFYHWKMT